MLRGYKTKKEKKKVYSISHLMGVKLNGEAAVGQRGGAGPSTGGLRTRRALCRRAGGCRGRELRPPTSSSSSRAKKDKITKICALLSAVRSRRAPGGKSCRSAWWAFLVEGGERGRRQPSSGSRSRGSSGAPAGCPPSLGHLPRPSVTSGGDLLWFLLKCVSRSIPISGNTVPSIRLGKPLSRVPWSRGWSWPRPALVIFPR